MLTIITRTSEMSALDVGEEGVINAHSRTHTRTHLTFLQRLATRVFALEFNLRLKKISQENTQAHTHKGSITVITVIISDSCCLIIKSVTIITIIITFIAACCWRQSFYSVFFVCLFFPQGFLKHNIFAFINTLECARPYIGFLVGVDSHYSCHTKICISIK